MGVWPKSVGRMASCASWAFFTVVRYWRPAGSTARRTGRGWRRRPRSSAALAQRRRVGAVVGDDPFLEEALGRAHRPVGREAELAVRLLLERRGRERRDGALGAGRSSTFVTVHGSAPRARPQRAGRGLVEEPRGRRSSAALRVEVAARSPARVADALEAGAELALGRANLRLEVPVRALRNAPRSSSRSTMSRTATLWTRPALRPVWTFFQRTGETM